MRWVLVISLWMLSDQQILASEDISVKSPSEENYVFEDGALSEADNWMIGYMKGTMALSGTLQVQRFGDPFYIVLKPITWTPEENREEDKGLSSVTVPAGFVTDFTSIPRIFWTFLPRDGDYVNAAVVHDYLYWSQRRTRKEADDIMHSAMLDSEISWAARKSIYLAVRAELGGGRAWDYNANKKAKGERRLISKYPTDPLTTWKQWKQKPDIYPSVGSND